MTNIHIQCLLSNIEYTTPASVQSLHQLYWNENRFHSKRLLTFLLKWKMYLQFESKHIGILPSGWESNSSFPILQDGGLSTDTTTARPVPPFSCAEETLCVWKRAALLTEIHQSRRCNDVLIDPTHGLLPLKQIIYTKTGVNNLTRNGQFHQKDCDVTQQFQF